MSTTELTCVHTHTHIYTHTHTHTHTQTSSAISHHTGTQIHTVHTFIHTSETGWYLGFALSLSLSLSLSVCVCVCVCVYVSAGHPVSVNLHSSAPDGVATSARPWMAE